MGRVLELIDVIEIKTSKRDLFAVLRMACAEYRKKYGYKGRIIPTDIIERTDTDVKVRIEVADKIVLPWRMSTHESK